MFFGDRSSVNFSKVFDIIKITLHYNSTQKWGEKKPTHINGLGIYRR